MPQRPSHASWFHSSSLMVACGLPALFRSSFEISWMPPVSPGSMPVLLYTVSGVDATNGSTIGPWIIPASAPALEIVVVGCVAGHEYALAITAANGVGVGPSSAPVTATPVEPPKPPSPANVRGVAVGPGMVLVAWDAVSWQLSPVSYVVTALPGGLFNSTSSTSCWLTGLENNSPYYFTVLASAQGTVSPPSQRTR